MKFTRGSIDITKAFDAKQVKKVKCQDGREHFFVNIAIFENQEPREFDGRVYTHSISCAPKKENREDGVNYYLGNLETIEFAPSAPTVEEVEQAEAAPIDDLPF
ncbi:MAG: hypothetical protein SNG27_07675 [Rikenellaceae bacterium]